MNITVKTNHLQGLFNCIEIVLKKCDVWNTECKKELKTTKKDQPYQLLYIINHVFHLFHKIFTLRIPAELLPIGFT